MGTLHNHPFFIRYQGGAGDHVVQISAVRARLRAQTTPGSAR